jgi:hypothetical protein
MAPNWNRLIRFIATDERLLRGEPILPSADFDVGTTTEETGLKAKVISVANGDIFDPSTQLTDEVVTVKKLLGPVTTEEVPIIRCIGLNFIKHSKSLQPCIQAKKKKKVLTTFQSKKAAALSRPTPQPS